jgi:hypothetical protein
VSDIFLSYHRVARARSRAPWKASLRARMDARHFIDAWNATPEDFA